MKVDWQFFSGLQAFEKSRRRTFLRSFTNIIRPSKSRDRYGEIPENHEYSAEIRDIRKIDIEGATIPLPPLPKSMKDEWLKQYDRFGKDLVDYGPFSTRMECGMLVLEGGMRELMRLELRRQAGDAAVSARMRGPRPACDLVDYPVSASCAVERRERAVS